jgi:cytochrome c553
MEFVNDRLRPALRHLLPLAALLAMSAASAGAEPSASSASELEQGRRIFEEGILPSGEPLRGLRLGSIVVSGAQAACANCHRRSGMGSVEGDAQVPPITGRFLFAEKGDSAVASMDVRRLIKSMNQRHAPYTPESLAVAIRGGMNNSGRQMSAMMPHFDLGDADMKLLTAYLAQLSSQWSPGVTSDTIRFATVIAPGVEPARRQALIETLRTAISQKNGSTQPGRRHMVTPAEMVYRTERKWELEVWDLQGPSETWAAQLQQRYRTQPVFALVSGLSNTTWQPVQDFCEREKVPCWFPSVALPPTRQVSQYSLYFSHGVALEADVLARRLLDLGEGRPKKLLQIYRDEAGRGAAQELERALAGSGMVVETRALKDGAAPARRVGAKARNEAIMLWLRSDDLAHLDEKAPSAPIYFSATLAGERGQLPSAWKDRAHLVYPYELPQRRQANLEVFHGWLKTRNLALVDEPLQSEAYFAVDFLSATLSDMLDNLYRDYLIERAENSLSFRETTMAEQEAWGATAAGRARNRNALGRQDGTTIYPHLSLAPGQRFASLGGYIVKYGGESGDPVVAESGWIVP